MQRFQLQPAHPVLAVILWHEAAAAICWAAWVGHVESTRVRLAVHGWSVEQPSGRNHMSSACSSMQQAEFQQCRVDLAQPRHLKFEHGRMTHHEASIDLYSSPEL